MSRITVGTLVRLTGKFLRSTGQYTGREPASAWTVMGLCNGDRWAIVDEKLSEQYVAEVFSEAELLADPTLVYRRIAVANLQLVRSQLVHNTTDVDPTTGLCYL